MSHLKATFVHTAHKKVAKYKNKNCLYVAGHFVKLREAK